VIIIAGYTKLTGAMGNVYVMTDTRYKIYTKTLKMVTPLSNQESTETQRSYACQQRCIIVLIALETKSSHSAYI